MHCPRCGAIATVGQTFCRACGFSLEKVAELLGEQLAVQPTPGNDVARLRERQQKLERWAGIAGLSTFALLLLTLMLVVFNQMNMKGGAIAWAGLLIILFTMGAAIMGGFQTYSKSLKEKLAQRPLPAPTEQPRADTVERLAPYREPLPSITDRTTELLTVAKGVETGKIDG